MAGTEDDIAKREQELAKLLETLSYLNDPLALQMLWAVNALQSDFPTDVSAHLIYPKEAAEAQVGDPHFALKWEVENLILLMLANPKSPLKSAHPDVYKLFETAVRIVNQYKKAKFAEEAVLIDPSTVIDEMPRMAHEQFLWQREFFHSERMYRFYYVYGQGECAAYFEKKYGLPIGEFAVNSVALFTHAMTVAWHVRPYLPDGDMGITQASLDRTLDIISKELVELRQLTKTQIDKLVENNKSKLCYLPSTLRQFPIIASTEMSNKFICPFPQLIIFRATSGLYYDIFDGPQKLLEEANTRFEEYSKKLIEARCPRFTILREQVFGTKKHPLKTPDLLLKDGDQIRVVFECKATKLTFAAQYADNQYEAATGAFDQIAKGMSQLWKFFARARKGAYIGEKVSPYAFGVILTLDSWFQLTRTQLPSLRAKAISLCSDEPDMLPQDMRNPIFCSIEDLDDLLSVTDEDGLFDVLEKSQLPEYDGWQLRVIKNPGWETQLDRKPYPFHISEIIPQWDEITR